MATGFHILVHHVLSLTEQFYKNPKQTCVSQVLSSSHALYPKHLAYCHDEIFQNFHNLVCWSTQRKGAVPFREVSP